MIRSSRFFQLLMTAAFLVIVALVMGHHHIASRQLNHQLTEFTKSSIYLINYELYHNFTPSTPEKTQAAIDTFQNTLPFIKAIHIFQNGHHLLASPYDAPIPVIDALRVYSPDYRFNYEDIGVIQPIRIVTNEGIQQVQVALIFDKAYQEALQRESYLIIAAIMSASLLSLFMFYWLIYRAYVNPIQVLVHKIKTHRFEQLQDYWIKELKELHVALIEYAKRITATLKQAKKDSVTDSLTQLPNRNGFFTSAPLLLEQAKRSHHTLVLCFIDLDNFKTVNDLLGHSAGDQLLFQFAEQLKRYIRDADLAARLGGDEFVVLADLGHHESMPSTELVNYLIHLQNNINQALQHTVNGMHVSSSIGVATFPYDSEDIETLLKFADIAMYKAKSKGKNGFTLFNQALFEKVHQEYEIKNSLGEALQQNQFFLTYQPQVHAMTGKIVGFEALVRWQHPKKGLIPPYQFIELLETSEHLPDFQNWLTKEAVNFYHKARKIYPDISISININRSSLTQDWLAYTQQILHENQVAPENLILELLERDIFVFDGQGENPAGQNEISITESQQLQIAIDDFGTGYSSLSYLEQLHIDEIKIDKSFVDPVEEDKTTIVLEATIEMAKKMQLAIVIEGVETAKQLQYLQQFGELIIQGYYFSPPKPAKYWLEQTHNFKDKTRA
jgi:diguanylate cyclase (GGDEF)-like protein